MHFMGNLYLFYMIMFLFRNYFKMGARDIKQLMFNY